MMRFEILAFDRGCKGSHPLAKSQSSGCCSAMGLSAFPSVNACCAAPACWCRCWLNKLAQYIIVVIPRLSVWMLVDLMLELILFVNDVFCLSLEVDA